METSIIDVALPRLQADLGFNQHNLSWILDAYVHAGWIILLAGSLVAGLAGNVGVELTGRANQGVGAALAGARSGERGPGAKPSGRGSGGEALRAGVRG